MCAMRAELRHAVCAMRACVHAWLSMCACVCVRVCVCGCRCANEGGQLWKRMLCAASSYAHALCPAHIPTAPSPAPCPLVHTAQLVLHCGHVSTAGGSASGNALRDAHALLASSPPLSITASTSMVERLTAAGMSHPLHALRTASVEEALWVVEVGASARACACEM